MADSKREPSDLLTTTPHPPSPTETKLSEVGSQSKLSGVGRYTPRLWCVIETLRGDPILCLWASESLCLIGTLLGRLVAFSFSPPLEDSISPSPIQLRSRSLFSWPFKRSIGHPINVHPETTTKRPKRRVFSCGSRLAHDMDENRVTPPGKMHLVAAYSDEAIRAVMNNMNNRNLLYSRPSRFVQMRQTFMQSLEIQSVAVGPQVISPISRQLV